MIAPENTALPCSRLLCCLLRALEAACSRFFYYYSRKGLVDQRVPVLDSVALPRFCRGLEAAGFPYPKTGPLCTEIPECPYLLCRSQHLDSMLAPTHTHPIQQYPQDLKTSSFLCLGPPECRRHGPMSVDTNPPQNQRNQTKERSNLPPAFFPVLSSSPPRKRPRRRQPPTAATATPLQWVEEAAAAAGLGTTAAAAAVLP